MKSDFKICYNVCVEIWFFNGFLLVVFEHFVN